MEGISEIGFTETSVNSSWINSTDQNEVLRQQSTLQVALGYAVTAVVALVMIAIGCGVDARETKAHFLRPVGIIVGFVCQFLLMPLIAFTLAKIAQMDDIQTLGLLLIGSCPGGTFSNIATYWASGDLGLSVAMTTVSNTLGLGMMPLLLYLYSFAFSSNLSVPFQTIGIALALLIAPVGIGMIIRYKWPEFAKKIIKIFSVIGTIVIVGLGITALVSYGSALKLTSAQIACAAVFPAVGMVLGYGLSSLASLIPTFYLTHQQRRTICLETGVQNNRLASAIIQLSFTYDQIVQLLLFPLAYIISQFVWIMLIVLSYRLYLRKYPNQSYDSEIQKDGKEKHSDSVKEEINSAFDSDVPSYKNFESNCQEVISKL